MLLVLWGHGMYHICRVVVDKSPVELRDHIIWQEVQQTCVEQVVAGQNVYELDSFVGRMGRVVLLFRLLMRYAL